MSDNGTRFTRSPDLVFHPTDDGLVVFNSKTDRIHRLNFTAGALFELCHDTHSLAELTGMMAEFYALDEGPADTVQSAVDQLLAEGLLVESHGG